MITVYGITNCDTVKKARAWLVAQGLAHEFYDFKKHGVPAGRLADWSHSVGWEKLLNRQGTTWRKLDPATQAAVVDAASAQALILANPSIVKRPVVEWPGPGQKISETSVGFDALRWSEMARAVSKR